MTRPRVHDIPSQGLPQGRFLYEELEPSFFRLYGRNDDPRLWIADCELRDPSEAAGPFEPHDAVRALRLANLSMPEGCELVRWGFGLQVFEVGPLPGHVSEWAPVDPGWLEPSVTHYGPEDISGEVDRSCCAPPKSPPDVLWDDEDTSAPEPATPPDRVEPTLAPIYSRYPALRTARIGSLRRGWNGHPKLSPVWAPTGSLEGGFYVADIALPEGT